MILLIWIVMSIIWGAIIVTYWDVIKDCTMDDEKYFGATCIGLFWPLTLPAYILRWIVEHISSKVITMMDKNEEKS